MRAAAVASADRPPAALPASVVHEIFAHARETHPEECCGLVMGGGERPHRVVRCTNVQSQRHARGESDLDARHGFWIDERELLRALRDGEAAGEILCAIYHSHVDTAAYLSHADLDGALGPTGEPLYPGAAHLVVAVYEQGPRELVSFEWESAARSFVGRGVESRG